MAFAAALADQPGKMIPELFTRKYDIDATYDAITAYLDEKGVDAQDSFVEEYANDVKDADDPTLQVNIYVLLK